MPPRTPDATVPSDAAPDAPTAPSNAPARARAEFIQNCGLALAFGSLATVNPTLAFGLLGIWLVIAANLGID